MTRRAVLLPILVLLLAWTVPALAGDLADGQQKYFNHEFSDALEAFQRAVEAAPDDPTARYHMGLALEKLGRTAEARTAYEMTLALDGKMDLAKVRLARLCAAMGDAACAREQYAALRSGGVRLSLQDQAAADKLLGVPQPKETAAALSIASSREPKEQKAETALPAPATPEATPGTPPDPVQAAAPATPAPQVILPAEIPKDAPGETVQPVQTVQAAPAEPATSAENAAQPAQPLAGTEPPSAGPERTAATPVAEAAPAQVAAAASAAGGETGAAQQPPKPTGRRVALVIGNGAYGNNALRNPPNDARAMAQALRRCGFEVIERINADRKSMLGALQDFGEKLADTEAGLFYFAGHGIQVKGRNFLIPTGAAIDRESSVEYEGVDVGRVMVAMEENGKGTNIVILDACRNNPFTRAFRSGSRGLAMVDAPRGTYIAYSTAPGDVAADGGGDHGLYTDHLLRNIETPGLPIEEVMKRVRKGVITASGGSQVPWESSSLTGDFSFVP